MEAAQDLKPKPKKRTIVIGIVIAFIVTLSVIAAVLFSQAHENTNTGPGWPLLTKSTIPGGFKFTFAPFSKDTAWSDVSIILSDTNGNAKTWKPVTTSLQNGTTSKWNGGSQLLNATLKVWCNITDQTGNGNVNQGDYVTLTTTSAAMFLTSMTYTITIMHNPSSAEIGHVVFQG